MKFTPPPPKREIIYLEEAAKLRENPGAAAMLREFPYEHAGRARSMANSIKYGAYAAFRDGRFAARSTIEIDDHGVKVARVYAWFIGND